MIAQVLLSQRFPKSMGVFDYQIPTALEGKVLPGQIVQMPFRSSMRDGVILKLLTTSSINKPLKELVSIIDEKPILSAEQLTLAEWMADYYAVSIGTIAKAMLPPIPKRKHVVTEKKYKTTEVDPDPQSSATIDKLITSSATTLYVPVMVSQSAQFYQQLFRKQLGMLVIIVPEVTDIARIASTVPGDKAAHIIPFHAKLNKNQTHAAWQKMQTDARAIIIGTKSAIFLPFHHLQYLIIDHEENQNHHQSDQNPRFDVSMVIRKLSELHHTPILYHSPAPSVVTYAQVKNCVSLPAPDRVTRIIDMREEHNQKNYDILSDDLLTVTKETLSAKKRIFLFLNKRGAASAMLCRDCGYVLPCPSCGQPAAYHSESQQLYCHRCNARTAIPKFCSDCGGINLKPSGIGTQSVESYVRKNFPSATVQRIDSDTELPGTLDADIIIGTTRAINLLPWAEIGLVGMVSADTFLHLADYRAAERTWQLMSLLRYYTDSPLYIQTFSPDLPAFKYFPDKTETFYAQEIDTRTQLGYPPAGNLIKLTYQNADKPAVVKEAERLYAKLNSTPLDTSIITPLHPKQHNKWSMYVLLRYSPDTPTKVIHQVLQDVPDTWAIDRDPETIL